MKIDFFLNGSSKICYLLKKFSKSIQWKQCVVPSPFVPKTFQESSPSRRKLGIVIVVRNYD